MRTRSVIWALVFVALVGFCAPLAHASGGGESKGVDPLAWKSELAIFTGILFLLVMLVLWFVAWGPIAEGLSKREGMIADEIAAAERQNEEARGLLAQYEKRLADSEDDIRRMLENSRRDAEKVSQEIVATARENAEAEHRRALADIETATAGALKELAEKSADLAVGLAGKIVAEKLDPTSHQRLIAQAVTDFTRDDPSSLN